MAALGDDLGWRPTEPVRVEIYPEVADLARVSTLTLKEIETSGTIALCKYNRLDDRVAARARRRLSVARHAQPRVHALRRHARVAQHGADLAARGLAKFEERRWRGPSGGGLTPVMEHLLATGLARKHLITFAEMHPSMAKLPSQEDTALAFAEVYTVVEYPARARRLGGAARAHQALRRRRASRLEGERARSGEFEATWRSWLRGRKLRLHPGLLPAETELRFKKGAGKPTEASEDDSARIGEERARKLARLGGMLRARHRLAAAATEYEKARSSSAPATRRWRTSWRAPTSSSAIPSARHRRRRAGARALSRSGGAQRHARRGVVASEGQ